jgi:hypothetical protein
MKRRKTAYNRRLAKMAVQYSSDTLVVNQFWFSASTFVLKIDTFAKAQPLLVILSIPEIINTKSKNVHS